MLCTKDDATGLDSCDFLCISTWGKVPLLNVPWAHGRCEKNVCVCSLNEVDLRQFMPCHWMSSVVSLETNKRMAEKQYQAKVSKLSKAQKFEMFIKAYKKQYGTSGEKKKRFKIFSANLVKIDKLMYKRKDDVIFGIGPFTDLTREEFVQSYIGKLKPESNSKSKSTQSSSRGRKSKTKEAPSLHPRMLRRKSRSNSDKKEERRRASRSPRAPPRTSQRTPIQTPRVSPPRTSQVSLPPRTSQIPLPPRTSQISSAQRTSLISSQARTSSTSSVPRRQGSRRRDPFVRMDGEGTSRGNQDPGPRYIIGAEPQGVPLIDWRIPAYKYPAAENQHLSEEIRCGACWAFAAVGAVEILWTEEVDGVTYLSKQDLIDCVPENDGCEGGWMHHALEHISVFGIALAEHYPYKAVTGDCKDIPGYLRIGGWARVGEKLSYLKRQEKLEEALKDSPLPTLIHFPDEFQHYLSGVYDGDECKGNLEDLDHAVVIVGHYSDSWILRNSCGSAWGLQGHYLVKKGRCGVGLRAFEIKDPLERLN
nr:PREDICTED: uncharacterized protein LOC109037653 [Bemisia tabaci]